MSRGSRRRTPYRQPACRPQVERLEDRSTPAAGLGLQAQYYDNADLTGLAVTRTEPAVNFNWAAGSPDPAVGADTFSARWSGEVEAKFTEAYTFTVTADDGVRLWVNGQQLVNRWVNQAATPVSGTINLVAGRRYDIVLEYYENTGQASVKLEWQSASQAREVVPAGQAFPAERGGVSREVWTGIPGTAVADLTAAAGYPNSPAAADTVTAFEAPANTGDNYGQRLRALLTAPATGKYTFAVAADDTAELWLSNSADPAGRQRVATVPGWTNPREWTKYPAQRSASVNLVAGQVYYLEALHKEGTGGDHLAVGWSRPGQTGLAVIPGEHLAPVRPAVSLYAEAPTTAEGSAQPARFRAVRTGGPLAAPLVVRYAIRGTATAGTDYQALTGTVTIPAGQASAFVDVSPLADAATEGAERVTIELQDGPGYDVGLTSERTATATIQDDVNAPAGGTALLAGTARANFNIFGATGTGFTDPTYGTATQAVVATAPANPWNAQIQQATSAAVRRGDVLYVEFYARSGAAGDARLTAVFERAGSPYNKSLSQDVTVGGTWTRVQLPFTADDDYAAGGANFSFFVGQQAQTVQLAGIRLLGYGPPANLAPAGAVRLNSIGGTYGSIQTVNVTGQPFAQAYQLVTATTPPNNESWRLQGQASSAAGVQAGDVLRIQFYARAVAGTTPRIDLGVQRTDTYAGLLYQTINPSTNWTLYTYDVTATAAFGVSGLQVVWNVGFAPQTVQVAGFTWRNTTRGVDPTTLPTRSPATGYGGREGTAGWRAEADARIAQSRTAPLTVNVRDGSGNPVTGAVVNVRQLRHGFKFGSAISGYSSLLAANGPNANAPQYQALVKRLFNTVVLENNLKWGDFLNNRQLALDSANWARANSLYLRGHTIVWPSRSFMPGSVWAEYDSRLASQGAAAAADYLRATVAARVQDAASTLAGIAGEWDVVNEPFANNDVMRILDGTSNGQPAANSVLLDWFRQFRQADPNGRRVLNDYSIFARNGSNTAHRANYEGWVDLLKQGGLIEGLGEQSHYNEGNLTDIATLGTLITQYANRWSLPVAITEFDVNTTDEQLQADYLRDYLTMTFSQPGVDQFLHWGFWAGAHWLPDAALYRQDFSVKPNGQAYEDLLFGDWWTDVRGTTWGGSFATRGFQGEYEVLVTLNGLTQRATVSLGAGGATLTVTLGSIGSRSLTGGPAGGTEAAGDPPAKQGGAAVSSGRSAGGSVAGDFVAASPKQGGAADPVLVRKPVVRPATDAERVARAVSVATVMPPRGFVAVSRLAAADDPLAPVWVG